MELGITGAETADQLIKQLVYLRHLARRNILLKDQARELIRMHRGKQAALSETSHDWILSGHVIAALEENLLQFDFHEIEAGNYLAHLCRELDKKATREAIFDAINTNRAHRDTADVRKYGDKCSHLICVLDLENSATEDDEIASKPLKWCHTMAFLNAMQTNPKLDRVVHDSANEFFNGAFGEYRERPLTERLVGRGA